MHYEYEVVSCISEDQNCFLESSRLIMLLKEGEDLIVRALTPINQRDGV